jgi:hypothetical protein
MLFSIKVSSQHRSLNADSLGPTLRLETGFYLPLAEFKNTIGTSPTFSIIGGIPLNDHWRIDPALTFFIPQSSNEITIKGDSGDVQGRINTLSGHIGASLNRVEQIGSRVYLEARAGTGFSFIQTDTEKENVPEDSNDNYYGSKTIFLQTGIGIKIQAFRYSYIGLEFNYYFTPYNLFGERFVNGIGNQAMSVGVSYGL